MRRWILALALVSCTPAIDHAPICAYLGMAEKQLEREARSKQEVMAAMSALDPSQPPSVRIQTILETTQLGATAAWHTGFGKKGSVVPPACASLQAEILELHRTRNLAIKTLLLYWADKNMDHLEQGTDGYRRSDTLFANLQAQLKKMRSEHACPQNLP